MKKRIIQSLLAIACCVTVALSAIPTAEAAMRASVVTGKVMLAEAYQSLIAQQDLIISHIYATGQTVIPPNE